MDPIKLFIRRPVFTLMLMVTLVVFGLYSYPKIGVDQFPDADMPVVTITTILPGADPETVRAGRERAAGGITQHAAWVG